MAAVVKRVLLASPRGYCAGVERAIETVERALEVYGAPVYVRKPIVHNAHVVRDLEARGAVFVESEEDAPEGSVLVLSAHGVAPAVHERAQDRSLRTIDATCPLVAKVHAEARRFAAAGYTILLVGHAGHDEGEGTLGEAPEATVLIEAVEDAERVQVPDPERVAYVTQTTLSVDETDEIVATLRRRFPAIEGPQASDICYATTNRQRAVKELATEVDVLRERLPVAEGWVVAADADLSVELDPALDSELELRGRVLDLIHAANVMRKERGLEVTDRIVLTLSEDDRDLLAHEDQIKRETLAVRIESGDALGVEKA